MRGKGVILRSIVLIMLSISIIISYIPNISDDKYSGSEINIAYAEEGEDIEEEESEGEGANSGGVADKAKELKDKKDEEDGEDSEEDSEEEGESEDSTESEESSSGSESSGGNNRGEITGSLEHDPFVKNKPVQNTTGVKTGDEGSINASESFVVGQWVYILLDIIMIGILVLLALYMLLLGVVVLIISFFNPLVANNGIVRFLLGEKMIERIASEGVKGVVGMLFMRFFIGILLMMFAVTGYVNNVQVIILEFFINLLR